MGRKVSIETHYHGTASKRPKDEVCSRTKKKKNLPPNVLMVKNPWGKPIRPEDYITGLLHGGGGVGGFIL